MRDMLVQRYMSMNLTPAQFKAVSQSLGHSDVLTTLMSYGTVPVNQQSDLVRSICDPATDSASDLIGQLEATISRLRQHGRRGQRCASGTSQ